MASFLQKGELKHKQSLIVRGQSLVPEYVVTIICRTGPYAATKLIASVPALGKRKSICTRYLLVLYEDMPFYSVYKPYYIDELK